MSEAARWFWWTFFFIGSLGGWIYLALVIREGLKTHRAYHIGFHRPTNVPHVPAPWAPRINKEEWK